MFKNQGSEPEAAVWLGQSSVGQVISVHLGFLIGKPGNNNSTDLKD